MGFIVRLHQPSHQRPLLIGRVLTASDALALVRRWRDDNPDAWVEIIPPQRHPTGLIA